METTPRAAEDQVPLPEPRPGTVAAFRAMMVVVFLAAMDSTVVATVLPSILAELGGAGLLAWVVTSYLLTTAVSIPLWGKAADLAGSRSLYVAASVVFLLGSASVAFAPTMPVMLIARAIQGLGTGGLMALTPIITGELFPARIRGRYHGRQGAVLAGASILGPLIGGIFAGTLGWRAAFWINLPLVIPAMIIAARCLPPAAPSPPQRRRIDILGAVLIALASSALLLALSEDTPLAAEPYRTALLVTATLAALAYLLWQARHSDPVLPLRVMRSRIVAAGVGLSFITGAAMIAAVVHAPLFTQTVQGHSAATAGALLLPLTGGVLVANLAGGNLITRFGRYRPFLIIGSLAITAGFGLLTTVSTDTGTLLFVTALTLVGSGLGLTMQPAVLALQNAVDAAHLGAATAASTFFRQLGSTLAIGVLGGLLTGRVGPQLDALTHGLRTGPAAAAARVEVSAAFADLFTALTPVAALAVILALVLPEKPLSVTTPSAPAEKTDETSNDLSAPR